MDARSGCWRRDGVGWRRAPGGAADPAGEGRPLEPVILAQAAALARHWEAGATGPLRAARRGLKAQAPPIDDEARQALREQVRTAEFAAERLLMETLEALA